MSYYYPELGTGEVWSDPERPIIHFGSAPQKPKVQLLDAKGKPMKRGN